MRKITWRIILLDNETTDPPAVETVGLTKVFGKFKAVDDLHLRVRKGEVYGLLGPNGAGKTTTVKMLCGVIRATSGEMSICGRSRDEKGIAYELGYMPQETALYIGLTVHQNIQFFGEVFGLPGKEIARREEELLDFVDLADWRDELVENLSGGMKHRVSLACAMINEPPLLLLDEPTVGVDPELRASFWNRFDEIKSGGSTILITTHYMDEARNCDRIGFMRDGRLLTEGFPEEILRDTGTDSLEDAFLVLTRRAEE